MNLWPSFLSLLIQFCLSFGFRDWFNTNSHVLRQARCLKTNLVIIFVCLSCLVRYQIPYSPRAQNDATSLRKEISFFLSCSHVIMIYFTPARVFRLVKLKLSKLMSSVVRTEKRLEKLFTNVDKSFQQILEPLNGTKLEQITQ